MLDKTFAPKSIEQKRYAQWEQSGAFSVDPQGPKTPHVIMMPPPNVTGFLHIGHGLTMTLQDTLTRYYRMRGYDALWLPGTDHAGIATQLVVERKLREQGHTRTDFSRSEFLEKVWEWKAQSGGQIKEQLKRIGASCDWSREAFTMDDNLSRAVLRVFVQLYKEKLIYRAKRLVNWDPKMHTALSDLEVVQKEQKGHMWTINYAVEGAVERFIPVATTRPETMLGDTAVVVNPNDDRYKDLIGKFAVVPVVGRVVPIIADDYVDPAFGTGAMKVTPAHDFNDFALGQRHNLQVINVMDKNACINENGPEGYVGLDRFDARKKILAELEELDLLARTEDITHSVPYDEKTKSVLLEPFLTDQWYVDAEVLAKPALEAVETGQVELVPEFAKNTYFEWLRNIQPWCISRQLWWGHQIPAWYGPDGAVFVAETEEEAQAQADAHYGERTIINRDPDVLDTWFSSALWPFSTLGWPDQTPDLNKYYPGDVLVTGFDIIFFWVARMMMMGIHFMGKPPFKRVFFNGLIRDGQGQKMSKTKGNVVDPLELVDEYGADALRFTMASCALQGRDVKMSADRVEISRNFATKLWNAARYAEMNECVLPPDFNPAAVTHTLNKWVIGELGAVTAEMDAGFAQYKLNDVASSIYQFVWRTFCDWYLEFTKPILAGQGADDTVRAEVRATTAYVIYNVLKLLNPIMPYLTEELYEHLIPVKETDMLITASWPIVSSFPVDQNAKKDVEWLIDLITAIRSVRADMNVPASAKTRLVVKDASSSTNERLARYNEVLSRIARIEEIEILGPGAAVPKGAVQTVLGEATYCLPVADLIDLNAERARLSKEIDKLSKDIARIDQKLANTEFVSHAPAEIIEEQRTRRAEHEVVLTKLSAALALLQAA